MTRLPAKTRGPVRARATDEPSTRSEPRNRDHGATEGRSRTRTVRRLSCCGFRRFVNERGCRGRRSGGWNGRARFHATTGSRRMPSPGSKATSPTGSDQRLRLSPSDALNTARGLYAAFIRDGELITATSAARVQPSSRRPSPRRAWRCARRGQGTAARSVRRGRCGKCWRRSRESVVGVGARDRPSFVIASAILAVVALPASFGSALRAMRIHPSDALSVE